MSASTDLYLVDTNILVHAYDQTNPVKHAIASRLVEQCWQRQTVLLLTLQNLAEFVVVITKKVPQPLSVEQAEQIVKDILAFSHWQILYADERTLPLALSLYKKTNRFWDAMIAATMLQHGFTHIYTEDVADFRRFTGLTVKNPFAPAP